jgi:hypothetical protein
VFFEEIKNYLALAKFPSWNIFLIIIFILFLMSHFECDKLVNNNHKWNLWKKIDNTIITYLSKYIFINNIEYDFTKIDDLKKYNLYVEFIKNNDIKSSYTLFNKLLNDHINNIYIMNSAGKTLKSFSNADGKLISNLFDINSPSNNGLIINIIKKNVIIDNVDIILKYLEVNYQ